MKKRQWFMVHGNTEDHQYFLVEQLVEAINEIINGQLPKEEKLQKVLFLASKVVETIKSKRGTE